MKFFNSTLAIALAFFSLTAGAAKLGVVCDSFPTLIIPLMNATEADSTSGSVAFITNLNGEGHYLKEAIFNGRILRLDSVTYCGKFFSSSPCPSDVYKKGGSRMSSNMVFDFINKKGEPATDLALTINKDVKEMNTAIFSAKVTTTENGTEKVRCTVQEI